jgi:hypothetical protein
LSTDPATNSKSLKIPENNVERRKIVAERWSRQRRAPGRKARREEEKPWRRGRRDGLLYSSSPTPTK